MQSFIVFIFRTFPSVLVTMECIMTVLNYLLYTSLPRNVVADTPHPARMSDLSDQEEDPPHLARYREYKRRKEQRKLKHTAQEPAPAQQQQLGPQTPLERAANHRLTIPGTM